MGANTTNALFFLVNTLFELYLWVLMLRIILQWTRADFYNPISQLIWQVTQLPLRPLQNIIPRWRNLDTAGCVLLFVVALVYVEILVSLVGIHVDWLKVGWYALLKLLVLALNLYTFTLFIQAVLSWVGPGVNNPAGSILWSINEPLLRPVRRVIPPFNGLDLSPLVLILALQMANLLVPLPGIFR